MLCGQVVLTENPEVGDHASLGVGSQFARVSRRNWPMTVSIRARFTIRSGCATLVTEFITAQWLPPN